jgi:hypothetical protein
VAASSIVPPLQTAVLLWAVCFALILLIAVLNTAIAVSALNVSWYRYLGLLY